MKKILITGINGYIGSNCKTALINKNYEVIGIDIYGDKQNNFINGEVDRDVLKNINQKFDIIIHLAGSSTVASAQKAPELEYKKTVGSIIEVLEYMRNHNPEAKLIYSSSAAVYGNHYSKSITEEDTLNPISFYGKHKVEAEKICEKYHKDFNLNINIIRFFSIYGEGLKKQLLWDFCNRLNNNKNKSVIHCFGTGEEKRDFVHIKDAIDLILLLINKNESFVTLNCGGNNSISIKKVLNLITKEFNFNGKLLYDNIAKEGDPKILCADIEKAKSFGYSPKIDIQCGIKKYAKWFKENN